MNDSIVPVIVVATREDDVELINRTLREAGHPVHCHWVDNTNTLLDALESRDPELLWFFTDDFPATIRDVSKINARAAQRIPLIVVRQIVGESDITDAMQAGAQDLVSSAELERLRAVGERELRSFRLERALNHTLISATQYKKQLKAIVAESVDAIAYVQEGILVEANQAWAELFGFPNAEAVLGPLMDCIATTSQAALKGALSACSKGHWDSEPLRIETLTADGSTVAAKLILEASQFDGEPAIKLSIVPKPMPSAAPERFIEQAIHTDPMTGFYHRRRFVELLTDRLDSSPAGGVRALAYIRPDKFGDIEHEVGSLASEDILVQLAELLRTSANDADLYGRFGGTVFTILIERGTLRDVEAWATNVVTKISDHIFEVAQNTLSISCTIGIAETGPSTDNKETLIGDAARANQRGRQRGGNQVVVEETSDETTRIQRLDDVWVQQIKSALVDNRFRLTHLPIASLNGDSERFYDTILRMIDQQGGEIPAGQFIPVAERNGLLRAIDRWVVAASIEFCAKEQCDLVFVKLSHESIQDRTLVEWISEQIESSSVTPSRICFQISEESATAYLKQTNSLAEQLKAAGFCFAIEHFGIGRDPTRILAQTPMNYLKIDGSLMQSLATDQQLQNKVRGFIRSAKKRKILTIAERIEDANTMAVLFQLGVGYMQGHYLQEPEVVLQETL